MYIDVDSKISRKFAEEFDKIDGRFVTYNSDKNFLDTVNNIKLNKYILEAEFKAVSETGLISLIECYKKSGGGIWSGFSIYCLVSKNIEAKFIERIVSF